MLIISCIIRGYIFNEWHMHMSANLSIKSLCFTIYLVYSTWFPIAYITRLTLNIVTLSKFCTPYNMLSYGLLDFSLNNEWCAITFNRNRALLIIVLSALGFLIKSLYLKYFIFIGTGFDNIEAFSLILLIILPIIKHYPILTRYGLSSIIYTTPRSANVHSINNIGPALTGVVLVGPTGEEANVTQQEYDMLEKKKQQISVNENVHPAVKKVQEDCESLSTEAAADHYRKALGKGTNNSWTDGWVVLYWGDQLNRYFRDFVPYHGFEAVWNGLNHIKGDLRLNAENYHKPMMHKHTASSVTWFMYTLNAFPYAQVGGNDLNEMTRYQHCVHSLAIVEDFKSSFHGEPQFIIKPACDMLAKVKQICIQKGDKYAWDANISYRKYSKQCRDDPLSVHPAFHRLLPILESLMSPLFKEKIISTRVKLSEVLTLGENRLNEFGLETYRLGCMKDQIITKIFECKIAERNAVLNAIKTAQISIDTPAQVPKYLLHFDHAQGVYNQGYFDTKGLINTRGKDNLIVRHV